MIDAAKLMKIINDMPYDPTVSPIQRHYMVVKAAYEAARATLEDAEREYVKSIDYTNPDGTRITELFDIADPDIYEEHLKRFYDLSSTKEIQDQIKTHKLILKYAEETLINWGLSIVPDDVAATLWPHVEEPQYRTKLLELAVNLDASTQPTTI